MIKISTIVSDIVYASDFALEGLKNGTLNLSAYADHIKPTIEQTTKKTVTRSSIVIALSRLAKEIRRQPDFLPEVKIQTLSTVADLFESSFGIGRTMRKKVISLQQELAPTPDHFLSIITGLNETTIIASSENKDHIISELKPRRPRTLISNLGAIRIGITAETYNTPNVLFSLLKIMASQKINIQSLTSATNEITFIVQESDIKRAFLLLHDNFMPGE